MLNNFNGDINLKTFSILIPEINRSPYNNVDNSKQKCPTTGKRRKKFPPHIFFSCRSCVCNLAISIAILLKWNNRTTMYILGIDTATIIQIFGTVVDGMIVSVVGVIDVTALLLTPPPFQKYLMSVSTKYYFIYISCLSRSVRIETFYIKDWYLTSYHHGR